MDLLTSHHENGPLDSLDKQIFLLSRSIIRSLDANLETRAHSAGEDLLFISEALYDTPVRIVTLPNA